MKISLIWPASSSDRDFAEAIDRIRRRPVRQAEAIEEITPALDENSMKRIDLVGRNATRDQAFHDLREGTKVVSAAVLPLTGASPSCTKSKRSPASPRVAAEQSTVTP